MRILAALRKSTSMTSPLSSPGTGAKALDLPPPFGEIALREHGDAFRHACAVAAESGAGALVWVRRFDLAEFAVVLEPEEPLVTARRALYLGLNAMADALASHCPPEKPLHFVWPDTITFDGAVIGGGRIAWPEAARETEPPPWLVFGGMIRMVVLGDDSGGQFTTGSSLEVEGFDELTAKALIESFARHLMVQVDRAGEAGFQPNGEAWLARLTPETDVRRGLDGNGDLLLRRGGQAPERRPLLPTLASPRWLDPNSGMPWL